MSFSETNIVLEIDNLNENFESNRRSSHELQNVLEGTENLLLSVQERNAETSTETQDLLESNSKYDGWSTVITWSLASFILIIPFFEFNIVYIKCGWLKKLILFIQLLFAICLTCFLIYTMFYLFNFVIDPSEHLYTRLMFVNSIVRSIHLCILIINIWSRYEELKNLILDYKINTEIATEIKLYLVVEYFLSAIRYLFGIELQFNFKENVNRFIKLISLIIFILVIHSIIYTLKIMITKPSDLTIGVRLTIFTSILRTISEIFYITICWMICSRFRHLNQSVKRIKDEKYTLNHFKKKHIKEK